MLQRLSDLSFYVFYFALRYRRKVVQENVKGAFPQKSHQEVEAIAKAFFRHLTDLIFESIKGCTISENEIRRRHRYTNIELLEAYYERGVSVTILGAHYGNWEWVALSLPLVTKFKTHGIYQKLNNRFMDGVLKKSRERNGMKLIAKKEVACVLSETQGQRITMGYIGDQSPAKTARHYWLKFLNQETAVSSGYEHFAKQYDTPVLYLSIMKTNRGFYEGTFSLVSDEPRAVKDGQIVESYMKQLESIIMDRPELWLWSHRRWKLKRLDVTKN